MASSSFLLVALLITTITTLSESKDFLVGGSSNAWKIPSSTSDSLNNWAESTRFRVGDSLVWNYDGKKDSVLQVTKKDYLSCNTTSPLSEHSDGHTVVKLRRSGPYYFIGGANGACEKGEKLIVVVMAPRKFMSIVAPSPAPVMFDGPGMAPTPTSGCHLTGVVNWGLVAGLLVMGGVWCHVLRV